MFGPKLPFFKLDRLKRLAAAVPRFAILSRKNRVPHPGRRLLLECLEDRLAPATATLNNGVLRVDFAAPNESIKVTTSANTITTTNDQSGSSIGGPFALSAVNQFSAGDANALGGQQLKFEGGTALSLISFNSAGVETVSLNSPVQTNSLSIDKAIAVNSTAAGAITISASATINVDGNTGTINGPINGAGNLSKGGGGQLTFNNNKLYAGPTTINAGILTVNGQLNSQQISVVGGTLTGVGPLNAVGAFPGGTISPGLGPGILNTRDLSMSGSTMKIDLNGTAVGVLYDQVNVAGAVNLNADNGPLGATLVVTVAAGFIPPAGSSFVIINNDGAADPVSGRFANLPEGANLAVGSASFKISYVGGDGNDVVLTAVSNVSPVAFDGTLMTAEDTPATGTLTATDSDSPSLTYSIVSQSNAHGNVTITPGTKSYSFAPDPDYNGPASFTFQANDGNSSSNIATVSITVSSVNDAPTGVNDFLPSIAEDSSARTIPFSTLTGNDLKGPANESGQNLTITGVSSVVGGTVSISGPNVIFTPAADFNGAASFTYTLADDGTTSGAPDPKTSTALVNFIITEVNDTPTGVNDTLSNMAQNSGARTIPFATLTANDLKGPANESGQNLTITAVSGALGGTVSFSGPNVIFTPTANFIGPASFAYTLSDDGTTNGAPDPKGSTAFVNFNITAVNTAPVAFDGTLSTLEDTPATGILVASDPDGGPLTFSIVTPPSGAQGTVAFTGSSPGAYFFTPAQNFNGTASFTFKANDGALDSTAATISITVIPVNDAPVGVNDTLPNIAVNSPPQTYSFASLLGNDSRGGGALENMQTLTITAVSSPIGGTVSISGTNIIFTPALNYSGPASFIYTLRDDGQSGSPLFNDFKTGTATASFVITSGNNAPVATSISTTTPEDTFLTGFLTATDADSPNLTYSIVTPPSAAQGTVLITNQSTGAYGFTPALNFNGTTTFTFKASDGALVSNVATVSITVTPVNDAPIAGPATLTTTEDTPITGTLAAIDFDGDPLTYTIVAAPSSSQGTVAFTNTASGAFTFIPAPNFNGTASFIFKVNDGKLDSNVAAISINVTAVNDAPVAFNATQSTPRGLTATGVLVANDVDSTNLTYSIVAVPNSGQGTVAITNAVTGEYSFTPAPNFTGQAAFTFKANDGALDSNTATITINVTTVTNNAPVAVNSTLTTPANAAVTGALVANDVDSPALTYSIVNQANAHGVVMITNPSTGAFVYMPDSAFAGAASFTFKANDGALDSNVATISITLTPVATISTLTATPLTTTGNMFVTFTVTVTPSPGAIGTVVFLDQGVPIPGGSNLSVFGGVAAFSTTLPASGSHPITVAYTGNGAFLNSTSNTQIVTINTQPKVLTVTPNGNLSGFTGNQHSRIVNLTVVFDQAVQLDDNALTLALHMNNVSYAGIVQPGGYGTLPASLALSTANYSTWTLTFSGNTDAGADGFNSLKDGVYDLNIDAAKVHLFAVPSVTMAANVTMTFHRLFGGTVVPSTPSGGTPGTDFLAVLNSGDNLAFRGAFNNAATYKAFLDFNGDGIINSGDNLQFRSRFNKSLTWRA